MACPRCGCRMVSKLGQGSQTQLICCDCGLRLDRRGPTGAASRRAQMITVVLLLMFGATAIGLMLLDEQQQNPSLLEKDPMNLNEVRERHRDPEKRSKRWIVVPRLPIQ